MHIRGWESQSLDSEREFKKHPIPRLYFLSSQVNPLISLQTKGLILAELLSQSYTGSIRASAQGSKAL